MLAFGYHCNTPLSSKSLIWFCVWTAKFSNVLYVLIRSSTVRNSSYRINSFSFSSSSAFIFTPPCYLNCLAMARSIDFLKPSWQAEAWNVMRPYDTCLVSVLNVPFLPSWVNFIVVGVLTFLVFFFIFNSPVLLSGLSVQRGYIVSRFDCFR